MESGTPGTGHTTSCFTTESTLTLGLLAGVLDGLDEAAHRVLGTAAAAAGAQVAPLGPATAATAVAAAAARRGAQ